MHKRSFYAACFFAAALFLALFISVRASAEEEPPVPSQGVDAEVSDKNESDTSVSPEKTPEPTSSPTPQPTPSQTPQPAPSPTQTPAPATPVPPAEPEAIPDTSAPVLQIFGLDDLGVYRTLPEITLRTTDDTDKEPYMTVRVSNEDGADYSGFELAYVESDEGSIATVRFSEETQDGIYVFTVMVSDGSGNTSSESRRFTLSRLNSVFALMEGSLNENGYLKNGYGIAIEESSMVPVRDAGVNVFCNGKLSELSDDLYSFSLMEHDDIYRYRYEIFPGAFVADGYYMVTVMDTDASGKTNTDTFEFINDNTAPAVAISGIENGGTYEEDHEFLLTVRDNIAVREFAISVNGQESVYEKDGALYINRDDGEDILEAPEEGVRLKLPEGGTSFTMEFRAADEAGNEYVSGKYQISTEKDRDATWIIPVIVIAAAVTILVLRWRNKKHIKRDRP